MTAKFVSAAKALRVGNGLEEGVQMGPVVSQKHKEKVLGYIEKGIQEEAKLILDGLRREDYAIDLKMADPMEDTALLQAARILEERGKRFFQDASAKVPLPEVARIFRKIAQKKEENLARLQEK